jgi:hypothetical protein
MQTLSAFGLCHYAAIGSDCFVRRNLQLMNSMKAPLVKQASVLLLASAFSLATALCASTPNTAVSQSVPSGPVSFSFTSSTAPVYDLTGSYQLDQQVLAAGGTPVNLSLGVSFQQDAMGRLRGSGVTNVQIGNDFSAATYSVSGRISGGGGKATHATFFVRWQSQGSAGANAPFSISVQYNLEVIAGVLNGTARGRAKLAQIGSGSIKSTISGVPLPAGVDGSWGVTMNLQPPGGSGSIVLPNGRSLQSSLASSYSAHSGLDRIKVSGTGGDRGITLTVNFVPATSALDSLSGTVLGQTVALKNLGGAILSQTVSSTLSTSPDSQLCLECHTPVAQTVNTTPHAQQCQGCHGPSANHAANDYDPVSRPNLNLPLAGTSCGACHTAIYKDWQTSEHATKPGDLNPPALGGSCAPCHSGSVRVSLLDGVQLQGVGTNVPLGCPTCHQPHQLTGLPALLRNPLYSTNNYFSEFPAYNYNPSINLCAQCHNHRGASWTISSEPPHQSPQYNMLLGTVGELDSGPAQYDPGYHGIHITNQCVGCHMQSPSPSSPDQSGISGHTFAMDSYAVCAGCHGSAANASNLVVLVSEIITNQIQTNLNSLNQWAITKAPAILGTAQYGTRAWEYTVPGTLSPGGPGPSAALQTLIPDNIKKSRFNLYLVLYDGSLGVHNPNYSIELLFNAQNWVDQELSP